MLHWSIEQRGVLFCNASASRCLQSDDGLSIGSGLIESWRPAEQRHLRRAISLAARNLSGECVLKIARPSQRPPLWVVVVGLPTPRTSSAEGPVALFIGAPEQHYSLPLDLVRWLYDLTPAEARLVTALINGRRLEEIAKDFGVTQNTIRTELRAVFAKTGTSRQVDLVKLVTAGPGQLYGPSMRVPV